jgi:glycosyltransferase involved in cell wall biosynthesis
LFLRLLPLLWQLRRDRPFDLIDAHFGYPEGIVAALFARVFRTPFSVTLRGSEIPFATYSWRRRLMEWALPQAKVIFTVSEELRQFAIARGVAPERIRKIPNGVDSVTFCRQSQTACRRRLGIPVHRKVIVSAGELIAAKGHHRVIRALPALLKNGIEVDVVIAGGVARGGRAFEAEIRAIVAELHLEHRVHMLGWVPRQTLAEVMAAGDVFCLASDTEGWPNVVHEALSCGTPVVATRVGAIPEMIPNSDLGLIVSIQDQAALTAALHEALTRSWDRDAIASWGRARGWDRVAEEIYAEFMRVNINASAEMKCGTPAAVAKL